MAILRNNGRCFSGFSCRTTGLSPRGGPPDLRELGIPAVVGCGGAPMRLKTGDRVRAEGRQGLVEILESA
jgi:hypothetical protein